MGVNLNTILNYRLPENQGLMEVAEMLLAKLKALPLPRCTNYDGTLDTTEWEYRVIEQREVTDQWGTYTDDNEIIIESPVTFNMCIFDGIAYLYHVQRWSFFTEPEDLAWVNRLRYEVFLLASALGITEVIYAGDTAAEWIDATVSYEDVKASYAQVGLWTNDFAGYQKAVCQEERRQGLYFLDDFSDFREEGKNTPDPAKICKMYDDYFQNSYYTNDNIRDKIKFAEQAKKGDWYLTFYLLNKELSQRKKQLSECLEWAEAGVKILKELFPHRLYESWANRFWYLASLTYLWSNQPQKAYDLEPYWIVETEDVDQIFVMKRYFALLLVKKHHEHFEAFIQQNWVKDTFNDFYWYYHYAVLYPNKIMSKEHYCLFQASSIIADMEILFGPSA
ncbi:MAG: hypothetical protein ACK41O_19020 [Runella zeae]